MVNQCVHCGKIIEAGSREILDGCSGCGGHFFFYIKDEAAAKIRAQNQEKIIELDKLDKKKVEEEVRDILDVEDDEDPIILELESVRVTGPGKFEIDLVGLINRKPIVFKLEEGKYFIDLESALPRKIEDKK